MKKSFINHKYHTMLVTSILSEAAVMILQISDTLIAGAFVGSDGTSAVSLVSPIVSGIAFLATMVGTGCATLYTRAVGAFDTKKANHYFSEGLIAVIAMSFLCFLGGSLFFDMYIESYGVSDNVLALSQEYCFYNKFSFFLMPIFLFLTEMVYADGDEDTCNICNLLYFVSNLVLSILTSSVWGMRGIGFGSFIGLALGTAVLTLHFFRKSNQIRFVFCFRIKELLEMMKYSFLDASAYLYSAVSIAAINAIIMQRFGEAYLPVYAAVISLTELTVSLDGVGDAMLPLINVFRGEENGAAERALRRHGNKTALWFGLVFAVIIVIFSPFLPKLFNLGDGETYFLTVKAFRYLGLASVATSVLYLLTSYYLVSEHILLASLMIGANSLLFPVGLGYLFSFPFGLDGLWIASLISGVATLAIAFLYILLRYGKKSVPFIYEPKTPDTEIYNFTLTVPEIMQVRDQMEQAMRKRNIAPKQINRVMLLCEEMLQLIMERNNQKPLLTECTLLFGEKLELIIRDSGVIFDLTDEDLEVTSLRSMVVSSFVTHIHDKENLVTTSYNRNVFMLPLERE